MSPLKDINKEVVEEKELTTVAPVISLKPAFAKTGKRKKLEEIDEEEEPKMTPAAN